MSLTTKLLREIKFWLGYNFEICARAPHYAVSTESMATTALEGIRLCKHRTANDALFAVLSGRIDLMNGRCYPVRARI